MLLSAVFGSEISHLLPESLIESTQEGCRPPRVMMASIWSDFHKESNTSSTVVGSNPFPRRGMGN